MDIVVEPGWRGLTAREAEVVSLVARGMANHEVAARLHLSEHTVKTHLSRIFKATGIANRIELRDLVIEDTTGRRQIRRTVDDIAQYLATEHAARRVNWHQARADVERHWHASPATRAVYRGYAERLLDFLGVEARPVSPAPAWAGDD